MFVGIYELLNAIVPQGEWLVDLRWVLAGSLISIGSLGLLRRYTRGG